MGGERRLRERETGTEMGKFDGRQETGEEQKGKSRMNGVVRSGAGGRWQGTNDEISA